MEQTKTITPELKAQCIQEALDIKNAAAVARRHGLPVRLVQQWVHAATKHGVAADPRALKKAWQQATTENAQLKRLIGPRAKGQRTVLDPWQVQWLDAWDPERDGSAMLATLASMLPELSRLNRVLSALTGIDSDAEVWQCAWDMII